MHDLLKLSRWTVFKYFRILITWELYVFIKAGPIRVLLSSINKTFVSKEIGLLYVLETFKMYASL